MTKIIDSSHIFVDIAICYWFCWSKWNMPISAFNLIQKFNLLSTLRYSAFLKVCLFLEPATYCAKPSTKKNEQKVKAYRRTCASNETLYTLTAKVSYLLIFRIFYLGVNFIYVTDYWSTHSMHKGFVFYLRFNDVVMVNWIFSSKNHIKRF